MDHRDPHPTGSCKEISGKPRDAMAVDYVGFILMKQIHKRHGHGKVLHISQFPQEPQRGPSPPSVMDPIDIAVMKHTDLYSLMDITPVFRAYPYHFDVMALFCQPFG